MFQWFISFFYHVPTCQSSWKTDSQIQPKPRVAPGSPETPNCLACTNCFRAMTASFKCARLSSAGASGERNICSNDAPSLRFWSSLDWWHGINKTYPPGKEHVTYPNKRVGKSSAQKCRLAGDIGYVRFQEYSTFVILMVEEILTRKKSCTTWDIWTLQIFTIRIVFSGQAGWVWFCDSALFQVSENMRMQETSRNYIMK